MLAYYRPKPSADVRGYIATVGRIEPNGVPRTVYPSLSFLLSTCHVFKLLIIAAPLKPIIVQRTSIGENSNVIGDNRESPANGRRQVFDNARWVVGLPANVQRSVVSPFALPVSPFLNGHHCGTEIRNEFTLSVAKKIRPLFSDSLEWREPRDE